MDSKDLAAGGLLASVGLYATVMAATTYEIGTFSQMGPGIFPTIVGSLLFGVGLVILISALRRPRAGIPVPEYRSLGFVLLALVLFALSVRSLGLVPAIFLMTAAAIRADDKVSLFGSVPIAVALSILSILVFRIGLDLPFQIARWPF